jgi:hypothetical protein
MSPMKHASIMICAVAAAVLFAGAASAQVLIPRGGSQFNPPLPPPLPAPNIAPPVIPQMDAPVSPNYAPASGPSFSDRITTCLDQAAASGLGPSERAAYSRSCANQ